MSRKTSSKAPSPTHEGPTRVVYSAAVSLDGYIADAGGGVEWLHALMAKGEEYGFPEFMKSIDGVLMGSRTYEKSLAYAGSVGSSMPCWVFSKRRWPAKKGVRVTSGSPREVVSLLAGEGVRNAWLMGGGALAASFLQDGLIDEVSLALMPAVLGSGTPAFGPLATWVPLQLIEWKTYKGGALGLRYAATSRRKH
jgi:dihydrofolate reductase